MVHLKATTSNIRRDLTSLTARGSTDTLFIDAVRSSTNLLNNNVGYQLNVHKGGHILSGSYTNLYNVETVKFLDATMRLNPLDSQIVSGSANVLAASEGSSSVTYEPTGITKIHDNQSTDNDGISFFLNKSSVDVENNNGIYRIKYVDPAENNQKKTLYISGIENLNFLDQKSSLTSQVIPFELPDGSSLSLIHISEPTRPY